MKSFLKEFDGISLWYWNEKEVIEDYERLMDIYLELSEGKKRMVGCYLYDFGPMAPATGKVVVQQLDRLKGMVKDGIIEGVILHTNAVVAKEGYDDGIIVEEFQVGYKMDGKVIRPSQVLVNKLS